MLVFKTQGQIWTRTPTDFDWWEVELVFRVTGRGRIGADGLVQYLFESYFFRIAAQTIILLLINFFGGYKNGFFIGFVVYREQRY